MTKPPNAESLSGNGRRRDGSPLGMVDVVDVLDAFEAKRKRQAPKAVFDVERWRIGEGYYVTVTMPDSEPQRVTETFKTEGEAWWWIKNESVVWLNTKGSLVGTNNQSSGG
jgi:hypothetical protein